MLVSAVLGVNTAGVNITRVLLPLYLGTGRLGPHTGRVVLAFEAAGVAAGGRSGSSAPC